MFISKLSGFISIGKVMKMIIGITSYFDPGFEVRASAEQLFNVALTFSLGLFALSVIIPVS